MRVTKFMRATGLALLAMAATVFVSGCESSGGDSDGGGGGGGGGSVVGTWAVSDGRGGTEWWVFEQGGTWAAYRDSALQSRHFGGNYNQNGNKVKGDLTNPGVGEGEIDATVSGNTIAIDFIEHWHTPYKHVPLNGTKL